MTTDELNDRVAKSVIGTPEQTVETCVMVYQAAKAAIEEYTTVMDNAKGMIGEVMAETGQTAYTTKAGKVSISAASQRVSYDTKALDALVASNDDIARLLNPHRKVSEVAGTMRITAAK